MKFALLVAAAAAQDKLTGKQCDAEVYKTKVTDGFAADTTDADKCLAACKKTVDDATAKADNDYCCFFVKATTNTCTLHSVAKRDTWATAVKAQEADTEACAWEWKAGVAVAAEAAGANALASGVLAVAATAAAMSF